MTQGYKAQAPDPATHEETLAFNEMTEILKQVASESEANLVDIQGSLAQEEARGQASGAPSLFIKTTDVAEVHLTDSGADLLAKLLADALLSE